MTPLQRLRALLHRQLADIDRRLAEPATGDELETIDQVADALDDFALEVRSEAGRAALRRYEPGTDECLDGEIGGAL